MRNLRAAVAVLALGCGLGCETPRRPQLPDLSPPPDLARRIDLAAPRDLAMAPPDLAEAEDLATGKPDLRMVKDLAVSRDLAVKADLAGPKPDLARPDLAVPVDLLGADFALGCRIVLNEVQTQGPGGANDEFVEIFNPCPDPIDLAGYKLVYRSAAGAADVLEFTFVKQIAAAKAHLVIGHTDYKGAVDATYISAISAAGGAFGLRNPAGTLIDGVGWGTAQNALVEGMPAVAPAQDKSIQRLPDGKDSNSNANDLMESKPTPRAANQ